MAPPLLAESHGRRDRRIPLEHIRGRQPDILARLRGSLAVVAFFLWLGISRFRKMERSFADII